MMGARYDYASAVRATDAFTITAQGIPISRGISQKESGDIMSKSNPHIGRRPRGRPPKKSWDATYKNARFDASYVVLPDACWYWVGFRSRAGYGILYWQGKTSFAHRYAYLRFVGPIPKGLELDHLCRVPACVNWRHLEAVTHKENMLRSASPAIVAHRSGKCQKGHDAGQKDKRGRCVICRNAAARDRYARNGEAVQRDRRRRLAYQARLRASLTPEELMALREFDRLRAAKRRAVTQAPA